MITKEAKGKVIVLGFDGMDFDLTRALVDSGSMPNVAKLSKNGNFAALPSVFPPDSIPAWITVFSGLSPAEHGVFSHINYLLPDKEQPAVDTSVFHGKTFWDRIGDEAKATVCIVNPFMAYPVWPVNGVMISGPVFLRGDIQVSDPNRLGNLSVPKSMGGIEELPSRRNIQDFYRRTLEDTKQQAKFGIDLFRQECPDFFFQTFYTSDRVQHHLWRYHDAKDPTHPGRSEVQDGIKDFYSHIDQIIGTFSEDLSESDLLVIMSDHGHGMRCTHCFNINEYLRRQGYLESTSKKSRTNTKVLVEMLKNRVLRFMNDHDLEDYISTVAKLVPGARKLKNGSHIADYSSSQAYATDFAGTNPFGGLWVNPTTVDDYGKFRQHLIEELKTLKHEGKPVFEWITTRESMGSGQHLDRYPDILYAMRSELGTGFSMHCDLVTVNPTHKKISGGHRANGVFISNDCAAWHLDESKCSVANLYATLLSVHGLETEPGRGESFLVPTNSAPK